MSIQISTLPNRLTPLLGMVVLAMAVVMLFIFPSKADLPEGFSTPIIAFEFAQSVADVDFLIDPDKNAQENRRRMFAGLKWDMGFPFAYGGFIFLLILKIALVLPTQNLLRVGLVPALLIVPFDLLENVKMLAILRGIESNSLSGALFSSLYMATWLKWGAIGVAMGFLAALFWTVDKIKLALVAVVPALATVVCFISSTNPLAAEIMAGTVAISLLILAIAEFRAYFYHD